MAWGNRGSPAAGNRYGHFPMISRLFCAAALLAGFAGAAHAQQAGTYSGTAADGSSLSFTVAADPNTGALQVASANISFSDTCNPGSFTFQSSWGLGGSGPDFTGATGTYATNVAGYFDVISAFKFSGTTMSGTIENVAVNFVPASGTGLPKKAAFCKSPKQSFRATLQPGMNPAATPHVAGAVVYGATIIRR